MQFPSSLPLCRPQEFWFIIECLETVSDHITGKLGLASYPLILTQVSSVYSVLCNLQPVLKALKTLSQICRPSLA